LPARIIVAQHYTYRLGREYRIDPGDFQKWLQKRKNTQEDSDP
jgi:hypothetical protein